jgi:hypothetical protein
MRRVVIESPFKAGDFHYMFKEVHLAYLRRCLKDCFDRGEAPFASHGLYTQPGVLDDSIPAEREKGIEAGLIWAQLSEATIVYTDYGVTDGMDRGIHRASTEGRIIEYRSIGKNPVTIIEEDFI